MLFEQASLAVTVDSGGGGGSGSWASRWPLVGHAGEKGLWLLVAAMEVKPKYPIFCKYTIPQKRLSIIDGFRAPLLFGLPQSKKLNLHYKYE